mgnify:FL=1
MTHSNGLKSVVSDYGKWFYNWLIEIDLVMFLVLIFINTIIAYVANLMFPWSVQCYPWTSCMTGRAVAWANRLLTYSLYCMIGVGVLSGIFQLIKNIKEVRHSSHN